VFVEKGTAYVNAAQRRSGSVSTCARRVTTCTTAGQRHYRSGPGKERAQPFEDSVKLSIQSSTGFELGPHHNAGDSFNFQPLVPFSLNAQWNLIARPSLTVTYLPSPHEEFGLADLQTSFFLTPAKATTWIWGVGPIFQFPTASSSELGTGRWSAGPTDSSLSDSILSENRSKKPAHTRVLGQSDNGSEFTGRVLDQWTHERGVKMQFIETGKPIQNAFIESFNSRLRVDA